MTVRSRQLGAPAERFLAARRRFTGCFALFCALAALIAPGAARAAAYTVTGVVRNENEQGIANVDLAFIEFCSDASVFLPNHTTLSNGSYSIVVNEGTYDIHFTPPAGSTLAGAEISQVSIHSNLNLGVTHMYPGIKVAGTVKNTAGAGIVNVNLDFVDTASGSKVFVPNDLTAANGTYSVRVLPGTYDVEYRPAATTSYVTGLRKGVVATADVTGLVDTLDAGLRVFGRVLNPLGQAVPGADLNFYDTCLGFTIPTAHDNADASGNFSVYVPAQTYTVTFSPPRCSSLGTNRLSSQAIAAATDLGDIELPDAFPVTGRAVDGSAQPVFDAELKFYDAQTGARQGASRSHTNTSGAFSIYVPPGDYNVDFLPPAAADLLVARAPVTVTAPTAMGDVVLSAGLRVSGTLLAPGGGGARNVNINVVDSATRASVRLANDNTAENGSFSVIVPPGTFDFQYAPPACSLLAPADRKSVTVGSSMTLPTSSLVLGVHARGTVHDTGGAAVPSVDLDFFPAGTRSKAYTPNDNTDGAGSYDVFVAPGTYDIDYTPPSATSLRAAQRFGVALSADTTIPVVILHQGVYASGFVYSNATGLPVTGVAVGFYPPGGGNPLFTPRNSSATDGSYSVLVDTGSWDVLYTPATATGLAPRWKRGVSVPSNVTLPPTYLLPLTTPSVTGISPTSGNTQGGQSVTVSGSGFQPDATLELGGVTAKNIVVVSSASITATTPAHPPGVVDEVVRNPGNMAGTRSAAFTFLEPLSPVRLTVRRMGSDVSLTWTATGQASYTIFRNPSPTGWTDGSVLATTPATTYTDTGGALGPGLRYYNVD